MQIRFRCPRCQNQNAVADVESVQTIECRHCDWTRTVGEEDRRDGHAHGCLTCGCHDLWRQKNFPQRLGVMFAGLAIVLSTVAAAFYRPLLAIGVLMVFALIDLVLYLVMDDVLVCYRCGSRLHKIPAKDDHPAFNLETAERYRQEQKRLNEAARHVP